jgi:hypothetical protein
MLDWIAKGTEVIVYTRARGDRFEYEPIGYGTITHVGKTFGVRMSNTAEDTYRFDLDNAKHRRGKWDSPYYCIPRDSELHATLVRESKVRKAEKDVDRAYAAWKSSHTTQALATLEKAIQTAKEHY